MIDFLSKIYKEKKFLFAVLYFATIVVAAIAPIKIAKFVIAYAEIDLGKYQDIYYQIELLWVFASVFSVVLILLKIKKRIKAWPETN